MEQAREPDFSNRSEKDLRTLLWSSIDNDDSRDLDQVEYIKPDGTNGYRLFVGIANVDHFAPAGSALDLTAQQNTTSIYTGVETFPMLPLRLSTDLSSLNETGPRLAIVMEMVFDAKGSVKGSTVYPAIVHNKAQLTYDAVGAWLEGKPDASATTEKIQKNDELQQQLKMQDQLAQILEARRHEEGALSLRHQELRPQISEKGEIRLRTASVNRATQLIENFMIAANQASVSFLTRKKFPSVRRIVRVPKNWPRLVVLAKQHGAFLPGEPNSKALEQFLTQQRAKEPEHFSDLSLAVVKLLGRGEYIVERPGDTPVGHFGLALENYSHSTAPNRRYPDILIQRLLLAAFNGAAPSSLSNLPSLASHCTEREEEANKVERTVHKCVAAAAMMRRIGEKFSGLVTGASSRGVFVRISNPPIEGKLRSPSKDLDVGDVVTVRLVATDPAHGFIDFEI